MEQVLALIESTFELLDCVEAQIFWMMTFAKERGLPRERYASLHHLATRTRMVLQDLRSTSQQLRASDDFLHRNDSDDNFTEPARSNTYIDLKTPSSWQLLRTQFAFRDAGGGVNPTLKACSL